MKHRANILLACLLVAITACKDEGEDPTDVAATGGTDEGVETEPAMVDDEPAFTYWRDAKTVIDRKCGNCHVEGDIAPFALATYEDVKAVVAVLPQSLMTESMPPWSPSSQCQEYMHDRSLEPDELDLLMTWLDEGAPEGDPADAPPAADSGDSDWAPDVTIAMAESYTPQLEPDDYRCFVIPWTEDRVKYATGFRVIPGNRAVVHHVIMSTVAPENVAEAIALDEAEDGPGYTCFGGAGVQAANVASWVPGTDINRMPDDSGLAIQPGSVMVMQMHYNTLSSGPGTDQTSVELELRDEVAYPAARLPTLNPGWLSGEVPMHIPAGDPAVSHSAELPVAALRALVGDTLGLEPGQPMLIHSGTLHMHYLGVSARLSIVHQDDSEDCVLQIDDWDFNWQGSYQLRTPVLANDSDRVRIDCTWDNSAENQPTIGGETFEPQDAEWGEGTRDEMCLGSLYVTAG